MPDLTNPHTLATAAICWCLLSVAIAAAWRIALEIWDGPR